MAAKGMGGDPKVTDPEHNAHAGSSIIELLWEQADKQYARLMDMLEEENDEAKLAEQKGKLQGLAFALATMENPYRPVKEGMDAVRAELKQRWDAEQEDDEDDE